jgi:hypothetical protein
MLDAQRPSPEIGQKVSKLDFMHKYSLKDDKGRRFFVERTGYGEAIFETGTYKVIVQNNSDMHKVFRLETDIGFYYPMQMSIEPVFKYNALERTVGNAWRHVCMLVDEYREFIQHMEEVAE